MIQIEVSIIRYGYWGSNIVQNFNSNNECRETIVSDTRQIKLKKVRKNYQSIAPPPYLSFIGNSLYYNGKEELIVFRKYFNIFQII